MAKTAMSELKDQVELIRREAYEAGYAAAMQAIREIAETEQADFDGSWIASRLPHHHAEFRQDFGDIAAPGGWDPTIAIADRAPRAMREDAADIDRRVRFPHRFGPGNHRIEMDELPMAFGLRFRPDFLHRLDGFAHPLEAGCIDGAVVFHFVLVPASADAKQEASLAHLVDRGDQLGGLDRVTLLHQQHAWAEFDGLGDLASGSQHHERVHGVVILFG